jgi:hypothetical protein
MCTNRNLFRQNGLQKKWESQQLFFGGWLKNRIFEEYQQPAIQKNSFLPEKIGNTA